MKALVDRNQEVEMMGSERGGRKRGKGGGGEKGLREALWGPQHQDQQGVVMRCVVM